MIRNAEFLRQVDRMGWVTGDLEIHGVIEKYNPNHHPAGTAGGKGGQFAPKPGGVISGQVKVEYAMVWPVGDSGSGDRGSTIYGDVEGEPVHKAFGSKAAADAFSTRIGMQFPTKTEVYWSPKSIAVGSDFDGFSMSVYNRRNGDMMLRRDFYAENGKIVNVMHKTFDLPEKWRDQGIAKNVLRESFDEYERLGVQQVSLYANVSVGAYAWARAGFTPTGKAWDELRSTFKNDMENEVIRRHYGVTDKALQPLAKILNTKNPRAIRDLAALRVGEHNLGKQLLLGREWAGYIRLQDKESMAVLNKYVGRVKKYNPNHHPAGTAGGKGGQFAPKTGIGFGLAANPGGGMTRSERGRLLARQLAAESARANAAAATALDGLDRPVPEVPGETFEPRMTAERTEGGWSPTDETTRYDYERGNLSVVQYNQTMEEAEEGSLNVLGDERAGHEYMENIAAMVPEFQFEGEIGTDSRGELNVSLTGGRYVEDGKRPKYLDDVEISRTFIRNQHGELIVRHDKFALGETALTGKAIGRRMLIGMFEQYENLGVSRINTSANVDVGGYAWARLGFVPTQSSWNELRGGYLSTKASLYKEWSPATHTAVKKLLQDPSPHTITALAALRDGDINIGKKLLMNSSWNGVLNWKDPVTKAHVWKYLKRTGTTTPVRDTTNTAVPLKLAS